MYQLVQFIFNCVNLNIVLLLLGLKEAWRNGVRQICLSDLYTYIFLIKTRCGRCHYIIGLKATALCAYISVQANNLDPSTVQ